VVGIISTPDMLKVIRDMWWHEVISLKINFRTINPQDSWIKSETYEPVGKNCFLRNEYH
jgi:hypothetical protein